MFLIVLLTLFWSFSLQAEWVYTMCIITNCIHTHTQKENTAPTIAVEHSKQQKIQRRQNNDDLCASTNTEENSESHSNAHFPTHLCISRHSFWSACFLLRILSNSLFLSFAVCFSTRFSIVWVSVYCMHVHFSFSLFVCT